MARIELSNSGVVFNEKDHTYLLGDKYLSGITEMLTRQLFSQEYSGVPQYILDNAAAYGTAVHKSIEEFDTLWKNDESPELTDYIDICNENGLVHDRSEYTVTDGLNWASNIDKVYRDSDNSVSLADLKTYSGKLSIPSGATKLSRCQWQLSIYAYLLELQNYEILVNHLYVIHVRHKVKKDGKIDRIKEFIEVPRIPSDICKELLDCDLRGEQFQNPYATAMAS